ncbi:hypothetical protein CBR_g46 [Chara braunii]|uniref:Dihydrolipoamide acetyltransferase component of pyruvate dehydrogenase complex n=1 Tax=Chara braunii TaxID=69332 RepID=A0A388JLN4_CHABU|nr:hypothetical protein CBR_g46 [Chara braunii]|eukprot:GBG58645.1 hypothetical protein CBR_g46 [Chara braunii]
MASAGVLRGACPAAMAAACVAPSSSGSHPTACSTGGGVGVRGAARICDFAGLRAKGAAVDRGSFMGTWSTEQSARRRFGHVRKGESRQREGVVAKVREIFMPALSSTMTEGKIVSWLKSEGDKLAKGESVVVVESDKADMDVETFYEGILAAVVVGEGEVAPVGAAIGVLAETEEELSEARARAAKLGGVGGGGGESAGNGGAQVAAEPTAPAPEPVPVLASVGASPATATVAAPAPPPAPVVSTHPSAVGGRIVATPYAKKLAKEFQVDLHTVRGSGPLGRIVAADVEAAAGRPPSAAVAAPPASPSPSAAPSAPRAPAAAAPAVLGTTVPFTTMQAAVARNMVASLSVPTFRIGYTINTDALDALYKQIKSKGVTMTAMLAKAVALALAKHPVVNACCKDGKSCTFNSDVNVCVAVAIDGGLLIPVLEKADKVDVYSLSRKWKELVEKARAKELSGNFSAGTFTVSNLGMFGVDRFDAILTPGQGAIMAVGSSRPTVVATDDGMFCIKRQMQVNVTADHRIINGADLAAFLQTFAGIVENPSQLTL